MRRVPKWDWFYFGNEGLVVFCLRFFGLADGSSILGMMKFACNGAYFLFPVYEQALSKGVPVWHST
jgi:hypothetical protein